MQQTTTPLKGTEGSKRSSAPEGESGGVAMMGTELYRHMNVNRILSTDSGNGGCCFVDVRKC